MCFAMVIGTTDRSFVDREMEHYREPSLLSTRQLELRILYNIWAEAVVQRSGLVLAWNL